MTSAWECFHFATLELVRGTPIKQRLIAAYRRYLASLPMERVPEEGRAPYGQVLRALRDVKPLPGEDAVAASVRKMSNQQADECAALVVEIFAIISRHMAQRSHGGTVVQLQPLERTEASYDDDVPELIAASAQG